MEHLISKGYADWVQPDNKTECMVFYKPLDEWAKLVYDWARRYGNIGDVFTIYDLIEGDDSANEPFNGLDARVFYRIVARMQKQNLCQVFDNSNVEEVTYDNFRFCYYALALGVVITATWCYNGRAPKHLLLVLKRILQVVYQVSTVLQANA